MTAPFQFVSIATLMILPLCAQAQSAENVSKVASALGMTEEQFMNCLPANAQPGQRLPQSERRQVFACFKTANPDLTPSSIRAAMRDLKS